MRPHLAAALALFLFPAAVLAQGFSYQGVLTDNGDPANGLYHLRARLIDPADMLPIGTDQIVVVDAADGLFTAVFQIRFPSDPNSGVFLDLAVRQGADPFTEISHEMILPTPYAWYAYDGDLQTISDNTLYADDPSKALGVHEPSPLAPLHVQKSNINVGPQSLLSSNTTMILENEDSVLEIVSRNSGLSSGIIVLRDLFTNGNFADAWTFGKRTPSGGSWLDINYSDGVGTPVQRLYPDGRVVLASGTDVATGNASGTLVLGNETGKNLGLDDNEIMARNGPGPALLGLNAEGGDVLIGDENSTVTIDGDITTTPKVRSRVYSPADFAIDSGVDLVFAERPFARLPPGGTIGIFAVPLDLPHGATVTAISMLVKDDQANTDILIEVHRSGFTTANDTVLTSVSSSGAPGFDLLETTTSFTVDREQFSYFIECIIFVELFNSAEMNVYAVDVQYTTTTIE